MPRSPRLGAALVALLLAGCSSGGSGAAGGTGGDGSARGVAGGETRFVAGSGSTGVIPPGDRLAAPALGGEGLDGTPVDVRAYRGDVVVLNFWGSWCAPCRAEAPALRAVHQQTAPEGVRFVGVNIRDGRTAARRFVADQGWEFPSVYDQRGRNAALLNGVLPPQAIPSTLVLDRQQRIAARFLGEVTAGRLTAALVDVLAEPA